jgi:hypothetical protein
MRRWAPWALAFVVWNAAFDFQVKRAAEAFTAAQVDRWQQEAPPQLIRESLTPQVRAAAVRALLAAAVVLLAALGWARRTTRASGPE